MSPLVLVLDKETTYMVTWIMLDQYDNDHRSMDLGTMYLEDCS